MSDNGTSSSNRTSSNSSSAASEGIGIGVAVVVAVEGILAAIIGFLLIRRRRERRLASARDGHESQCNRSAATPSNKDDFYVPEPPAPHPVCAFPGFPGDHFSLGARSFSYEELRTATKDFSQSELLGRGGFGSVYRGSLGDDGSTLVAVKCIAQNSKQGAKEYKAEVTIISDLRHRNLVRLRGWCHDQGKFMLVYDYMPNGSLDYHLFDDVLCSTLSWERRYVITSGLGSALLYLHEECDNVIIHRDIKSSNVLLDDSFNAKLGDFGLSKQVDQGINSVITTVAGTYGYMAPELFGHGKATRETDVYAFGAVLLEVVCGKRAMDCVSMLENESMLVDWVWHLHSQGKVMEAVDKRLEESYDDREAKRMLLVGLLCSNPDPTARPKIRGALEALVGSAALPSVPSCKPILTYQAPPPMSMTQNLEDSTTTNSTSSSSTYRSANSLVYVALC